MKRWNAIHLLTICVSAEFEQVREESARRSSCWPAASSLQMRNVNPTKRINRLIRRNSLSAFNALIFTFIVPLSLCLLLFYFFFFLERENSTRRIDKERERERTRAKWEKKGRKTKKKGGNFASRDAESAAAARRTMKKKLTGFSECLLGVLLIADGQPRRVLWKIRNVRLTIRRWTNLLRSWGNNWILFEADFYWREKKRKKEKKN